MVVSGTREWAAHSENVMSGCSHNCAYCYAHAMAVRFGRLHEGGWSVEVPNPAALARRVSRKTGTVMYPTTHDLTPGNSDVTVPHLLRLLRAGNSVLVVSKPHAAVIDRITTECAEHRAQVLFRFSMGTAREKTLAFFEPGAPTFSERLDCILLARERGWRVSVSMEPLLEPDEDRVVELVELLAEAGAEEVWIGKLNRARMIMPRNGRWSEADRRAVEVIHTSQADARVLSLYRRLAGNPVVRWKESIKAVVGLSAPTDAAEGEEWAHSPPR